MPNLKIIFSTLVTLLCLFTPIDEAQARACLTSLKQIDQPSSASSYITYYDAQYSSGLSCKELDGWKMGLKAASYTFNVTGLALACTEIGIPVAVGMFGVGFVLYSAELVVDNLPCRSDSKEETERLVRQEVCLALEEQGFACNPQTLRRRAL